jgi:serine/threonine-protein kinase
MVYVQERSQSATLAWMDRAGTLTTILTRNDLAVPRISPDGRRIVFSDQKRNMVVFDIARGTIDVIVSGASTSSGSGRPQWHPDGQRIVFQSNVSGDWDLYQVAIPSRSEPERLLERLHSQQPTSWSPDGRLIAYVELHPETGFDLWVLPVGAEPVPVLVTAFNESSAVFSRDGRFLAYVSDVSGRREVYVRTYPEGDVYTISGDGGESPVWSRDGDEIFYRRGNAFMAVPVTTSPEFRAAAPELLHEQRFDWGIGGQAAGYDVAPGDERFVVVADRSTTELKVVFNWFQELERLMSTDSGR